MSAHEKLVNDLVDAIAEHTEDLTREAIRGLVGNTIARHTVAVATPGTKVLTVPVVDVDPDGDLTALIACAYLLDQLHAGPRLRVTDYLAARACIQETPF